LLRMIIIEICHSKSKGEIQCKNLNVISVVMFMIQN